jgi:hypothetical protein
MSFVSVSSPCVPCSSAKFTHHIFPVVALLVFSGLLFTGCGAGSASVPPPPPSQAVVITTQPVSETVPIDRAATFTAVATGTAPLNYQWSENGVEIAGATSASYTTPTIALSDSGSTFQVTVKNASSSATSNAATLTAGARAPALGDLRYLLWQQVPALNDGAGGGVLGVVEESVSNALPGPLGLGMVNVDGCSWSYTFIPLPSSMTGYSTYYQEDFTPYETYTSYLQSAATSNVVITSMDLEPACGALGVSWVQTQAGGFDYRIEAVPPSQIQATVAADGAESRIVTAVTFDDSLGDAILVSHGWQGDTTTVYEAQTDVVAPADVANEATILAGEGYFISAFGGNDTDGYMLIGMRVQGDSLPRPITNGSTPNDSAPETPVVWQFHWSGGYTTINEQ